MKPHTEGHSAGNIQWVTGFKAQLLCRRFVLLVTWYSKTHLNLRGKTFSSGTCTDWQWKRGGNLTMQKKPPKIDLTAAGIFPSGSSWYLQWWALSGLILQHLGHLYTTWPGLSCRLSINSLVAFPLGTAPWARDGRQNQYKEFNFWFQWFCFCW